MKLAVVGSREFNDFELVEEEIIERILEYDSIITGGAKGVDQFAEEFAVRNNLPYEIIRPINPSNKVDYLFRNIEIITKADKILAFWDGKSRGTKFVIDYAKARGKDIEVFKSKNET